MDTMSQRIAFFRKRARFTREDFAEKCSVIPQAVSLWENGYHLAISIWKKL